MFSGILQSVMVRINKVILCCILGVSSLTALSQITGKINMEEIPQRKVRNYIVSKEIDQMKDFKSIHASWKKGIKKSDFKVDEEVFYLKYKLSNVWNSYWNSNPFRKWNGPSLGLGLLILKSSDSVVYIKNTFFPQIDTGQVYFLNLRL